jgi:transcriptional regulator with XRE-family HTH domain
MNLVELAQRIKARRLERKMTLDQLAARSKLTRSMLSKVENFRVTPSLQALSRIAHCLRIPLAELLEGLDEKGPQLAVIRKEERRAVERDRPGSKIVYHDLAYKRSDKVMAPFVLSVPPGEPRKECLAHEGEEFLMVLKGEVAFEYGDQMIHLKAGDSAYFEASVEHRLLNPNRHPAEVLCVLSGGGEVD